MYSTWCDFLPFFSRKHYQLTVTVKADSTQYIRSTNVDDLTFSQSFLVEAGYGTMKEVRQMDTPEFLDLIEVEMIKRDIQKYKIDNPDKAR